MKANTRKNLMSTIDEIIEREYANQQLSSQFIADSCSISCVYLCRIWRQNTGSSLASRINKVRVDHASEMLKSTDLTIAEISERTGFSNQQYFYTLFKKIKGKTPDEFRRT
jgi:YesN/AraC family two-component response regulator